MPRQFPFDLQRTPRYTAIKAVYNPDTGQTDEIPLQYLDAPLAHVAVDVATQLVIRFIGFPEKGIDPKEYFPEVGGLPVEISESLLRTVANLYVMQAKRPDNSAIYSPDELIAFSVNEEFWANLNNAAESVNEEGAAEKNALGRASNGGSAKPSDTDSHTRNPYAEPIDSCVPSMNAYARLPGE